MISTALTTSFKKQLLEGKHNFSAAGGNTFKIALYTSSAVIGAETTAYTAAGEITGAGYTAGGTTLTNVDPTTSGTTAYATFQTVSWPAATFTANGALIYNANAANASVVSLAFGSDQSVSNSTFEIVFPTANASYAIIRIV
jgi:hypothetical protein